MSKTILVVAAHADDEVLGCGGAIARHIAEGDSVHVVFLADGVTSRLHVGADDLTQRMRAAENARRVLNITSNSFLGLPDNQLDSISLIEVIQPLEAIVARIKPKIIYTHHYGDLNIDHQIAHKAVMTACRGMPESSVKEILTFEVMSSTEWSSVGLSPFLPNYFIDISEFLELKIRALEEYSHEMRQSPHTRSIEHITLLAKHRGFCIGVNAAEAFMAMRIIR